MRVNIAVFAALFVSFSSVSASGIPSFVKSEHRASLQRYLDQHSNYYVPPDSLCECDEDLPQLKKREPDFQPYYAVGDLNDDGVDDFAIALSDRRLADAGRTELTVVIFHGPFDKDRPMDGVTVLAGYRVERPGEILVCVKVSRRRRSSLSCNARTRPWAVRIG